MKRFLISAGAIAVMIATCVCGAVSDASAQSSQFLPSVEGKFRKSISGSVTYSDTTSLVGRGGSVVFDSDTSTVIDLRLMAALYHTGQTNAQSATNVLRVSMVCSQVAATADSFAVIFQGSPNGVDFQHNSTEIACVLPSGGGTSNVLSGLVNIDTDNISGGNTHLWPYGRVIIRPLSTNNVGELMAVVNKLYFSFPISIGTGSVDNPRGDLRY